jgi:cell wall assembly regulator SMI1
MTRIESIRRLVERGARWQRISRQSVSDEDLWRFEENFGLEVPDDLRNWLKIFNGVEIGPGNLYGINTGWDATNIETYLEISGWAAKHWIPVAGDGCGNYYVMDWSEPENFGYPIYFIDGLHVDRPDYIVGSTIWPFIEGLLLREQRGDAGRWWPFDEERMLQHDPALRHYRGPAPLPWRADEFHSAS